MERKREKIKGERRNKFNDSIIRRFPFVNVA